MVWLFFGLGQRQPARAFSCLISLLEPVFGHLLNLPKWVTHHRGLFKIGSVHRLLTTTFYGHIAQSVHQLISRQVQSARHTAREEKPNKAKPPELSSIGGNWPEALGSQLSEEAHLVVTLHQVDHKYPLSRVLLLRVIPVLSDSQRRHTARGLDQLSYGLI